MGYLVEDLITSIKNRSLVPISQATYTESDLLALGTEEMRLKLCSDLIRIREDFFLETETKAIEANVANYAIPKRAIGDALKEVYWLDANSNRYLLPRGDSTDQAYYSTVGSTPDRYYIQGDELILLPKPSSANGSLLFVYPARVSELLATSSCAKITGGSTAGSLRTFTVNTDLTASLSVGSKVDFQCVDSPFKLWAKDVTITAITATTIEVALSSVTDVNGAVLPQTNDYICPAGFSNIPQIPIEMHPVLAQMVVVRLTEGLGDQGKKQAAKQELNEMRMEAGLLAKNRVESTPQRANRRNRLVNFFR